MADLTRKTANLTSTNTWKNANTTDTRSYFSASFQIVGGTQNVVNIRDTGDYTLKLTGLTNETVRFKHNGSTTDIIIFSYACNFSEPTDLTISFYANGYNPTDLNGIDITNIMMNTGSIALPYEPYGWVHSLRKLGTATETIQSGDTIYANGQSISTYSIKGNTVQNGTPTPPNPVDVNGVGERTENLFDFNMWYSQLSPTRCTVEKTDNSIKISATSNDAHTGNSGYHIPVSAETTYTFSYDSSNSNAGVGYIFENGIADSDHWHTFSNNYKRPITFTTRSDTTYIILRLGVSATGNYITYFDMMLNTGSTAKPYEPYGYKIPILTTQGSAINYLGSVQSTRKIKKIVFVGSEDENWSAHSAGGGAMRFRYTISNSVQADTAHPTSICTHLPLGAEGGTWNTDDIYTISSNYLWVRLDSSFTTVALLKSWLAQQYANGTPFTVWYVLATPETGIVNESLMKIGNYADTLNNTTAIPTTDGANTITVDTTVQPSEFTATWTGWHDSSVKEYQGGVGNQKFDYQRTEGLLLQ